MSQMKGSSKRKNAFFFFMVEKRKEMESGGSKFPRGYRDVAEHVSKEWEAMSQSQREKYVDTARRHNDRLQASKPSDCMSISAIAEDLRTKAVEAQIQREEARRTVVKILQVCDLQEIPIVLVNFNVYWEMTNGNGTIAIPAEVGLAVFSINDGIYDNFSSLIDPGEVRNDAFYPYKVVADVQKNAKLKCLPLPDYCDGLQNSGKILNGIQAFVKKYSTNYFGAPYIFCLESDASVTESCLNWLFKKSGELRDVKVLSLNLLMHLMSLEAHYRKEVGSSFIGVSSDVAKSVKLVNEEEFASAMKMKNEIVMNYVAYPSDIPWIKEGVFKIEKHVEEFLFRRNYAYFGELACLYHMELDDGVHHCCQNKVNRYAYSLLDAIMRNFKVIPQPGQHYPMLNDLKLEAICRREMLDKWTIEDPSSVVYYQFLKNIQERSLAEELESLKIRSQFNARNVEPKRRNGKQSGGTSSGNISNRARASDEFELG